MGKAIIIPDVSFASANLGQVTLTEEIPVRAISIVAPASFTGVTLNTIRIIYNPLNTSERGVTWSIISGSAYATINSQTGVLTVLSGANNNSITIKAVSTSNPNITATKEMQVTYFADSYNWVSSSGELPPSMTVNTHSFTQSGNLECTNPNLNLGISGNYEMEIRTSAEATVGGGNNDNQLILLKSALSGFKVVFNFGASRVVATNISGTMQAIPNIYGNELHTYKLKNVDGLFSLYIDGDLIGTGSGVENDQYMYYTGIYTPATEADKKKYYSSIKVEQL